MNARSRHQNSGNQGTLGNDGGIIASSELSLAKLRKHCLVIRDLPRSSQSLDSDIRCKIRRHVSGNKSKTVASYDLSVLDGRRRENYQGKWWYGFNSLILTETIMHILDSYIAFVSHCLNPGATCFGHEKLQLSKLGDVTSKLVFYAIRN